MVERSPDLDGVFHALADPTRRAMLSRVARGPQSVTALAAPHRISLAAASKHIRVLESAGLLSREVQGRVHLCHLDARPLAVATGYLAAYARFWEQRLDALGDFLDEEAAAKRATKTKTKMKTKRRSR